MPGWFYQAGTAAACLFGLLLTRLCTVTTVTSSQLSDNAQMCTITFMLSYLRGGRIPDTVPLHTRDALALLHSQTILAFLWMVKISPIFKAKSYESVSSFLKLCSLDFIFPSSILHDAWQKSSSFSKLQNFAASPRTKAVFIEWCTCTCTIQFYFGNPAFVISAICTKCWKALTYFCALLSHLWVPHCSTFFSSSSN